ncbi:MAG: hypothetical protein ACE5EJ_00240, partial [Nitrosopumilaceae archaeon]
MKISKKLFVGMFVIVLTLILVSFVAAQYTRASPSYVQPGLGLSVGTGGKFIPDRSLCEAGQDFVIQIAPFGCEPAVVPSDLLEEQNVPVFCQLAATQLNVLADVNTIDRISFTGNHPEEVSGVGFHPARAALGRLRRGDVARSDNLLLNNIGYAVIVLKKQPNEDAMPDFVEGNLTANIRYDIENAFGIGRATFYLQDLSLSGSGDLDLRNRFWNGRFYLDASSIGEKDAVIEIYDDSGRVGSVRLEEGKTSDDIFLPGFDCYAGVKLRLDDLTVPVPRAKLDVNGDLIEVAEGEKFLENRCEIKRGGINSEGIVQSVEITCKNDDGKRERFDLKFSPSVKLKGGIEGDNIYERGDLVKIDDGKRIYLVGVKKDKEGVLKVFLGVSSSTKTKLDSSELKKVRGIKEIEKDGEKDGINFIGLALEDAVSIEGPPETGSTSESIEFSENFGNAVNDFDIVINDFSNEKYPGENEDEPLLSEEALKQKILLAQSVGNQLSRFDYCREFEDRYPNSNILRNLKQDVCNEDNLFFSNSEIASTEVVVNNVFRDISLREIIQPSEEEYSLELIIRRSGDVIATPTLRQGMDVGLSQYGGEEGDFVKLVSLTETSARIEVSLEDKKVRGRKTIKVNEILSFGSETYSFAINKINLKKVAKVTVIPSIQDAGTTATFNYKIGIDKRLFTLSPEKAKKKIEALDKKIEKWEEISANLGGFVKGMKAACLATGAALTVKNLFTSTGGQALARQDVMNGPGGWYEKCAEAVEKGTLDGKSVNYASPEACLFDPANSDLIDKQVESYAQDLIDVNDEISGFEDNLKGYNSRVAGNLIGVDVCSSVIGKDNSIDFGSFEAGVGLIDENKRFLSEEDTRDLDLWRRRLERDAKDKRALEEYCTRALEIDQRYSSIKRIEETEERLKNSGIIGARARHFRGKDAKEEIYDGAVVSDGGFGSIPTETRVQVIVFGSEEYIVSLKPLPGTSGEYRINKVYDDKGIESTDKDESTSNGNKIATATLIKNSYSVFKSFDESTYRNPYRNPEVRYYETRNAQGQPAIVPIDTKNGWYVATSNVFQASDGLRAFSSSGRVESFWLCNVGENGLEQNRRPDDICQGINLAIGETYSQFHGLSRSEVKSLVDKGVRAIAEAERAHRSGIKKVRILGRELNVGSPAVDIPDAQCTDFMSPKDCKLLFNVCDPVICPSSRCDFGGSYPVKDVVQSGIVGSIALCLPNFQEGIVVPVCLTGIQSGIDSWNAVQKEYRSCLQDSVDTGQLTGICDEVYSIRACEFFWRQAFPLAKLAVPKLISFATGENVRGGGEYALVQSAWDNTEASVNYFTNYYAANSFKAFKARSADEFGGEICRNFVSGIVPSGNFFDALVEPDSPP